MKRIAIYLACAAVLAANTGCAGMTPQQRAQTAAGVGAALGAAAIIGAAVLDAKYSRPAPIYIAPAPVYVVPVRPYNPYCWQSAVTGQWVGC